MGEKLNQEMMESIDNYGSRIRTLKDFVTAVRTRPGMYIGPIGNAGFLNMIREIFQNCIDQIMDSESPCNWFSLSYDERTNEIICQDNGLGFPFNDIIRILTTQHTSKNFDKKKGEYSSGMNGVGAKIVNALSEVFIVESYHYSGKAVRVEFEKGYPKFKDPKSITNKDKLQGAKVMFIPDREVMGDLSLEWRTVYTLVKHIMSLTPIGSQMDFTAIDINGKKFTENIVNKDGIITDIIMKVKHPIIKPIVVGLDDGIHKIECAFCYDSGDEINGPDDNENVTSFCNFCPTKEGTHVDGCIEGITRWFVQYMNNIYLINQKSKSKIKVNSNDIKTGLNVMISAAHLEPIFTGQAKEILSNPDMTGFAKEVIMKGLDNWSKSNPQDLSRLSKFFKDIAEIRQNSEAKKAKVVTKYQQNTLSGLPSKYIRPLGKDNIELIIVEGDSALGTVETGRDPQTQGLFPIRGKIINAFKTTKANFFENAEVQAINQIMFRKEYKKGFTVEECLVSKIIFMADADIDGAHISALLLRMFVMYYPQLIEAGMVYKAIPPLYAINTTNKNKKYFTDQVDIIRYIQKLFLQKYQITTLKKEKLDNKSITILFMKNVDYIYHLERLANTYAVNPYLIEMVLIHYVENKNKINIPKLQKEIKSVFRFMDVQKEKNIIIIKGTIEKSNLIIMNDKFMNDCYHVLDLMNSNTHLKYLVNGELNTIYQIMQLYNKSTPSSVQRFKGLGEMDKEELAESTLYPGSDRTLIRYTLEDAKDEINAIREYESDSKKILSQIGLVTRDDLLD